ncbi:hypothetical protein ACQ858_15900 [Variovorax ureilyticus]|uniref:hypothetical protein n=1 Tax=Variovorax ureilyticus TaxID=1836198 RepID=UPI003D66AC26
MLATGALREVSLDLLETHAKRLLEHYPSAQDLKQVAKALPHEWGPHRYQVSPERPPHQPTR